MKDDKRTKGQKDKRTNGQKDKKTERQKKFVLLQQRVSESQSRTSTGFKNFQMEMKEDVMILMIPPSSDSKVNYYIATNSRRDTPIEFGREQQAVETRDKVV